MIPTETANKSVRIFDSTYELVNQYRGKKTATLFIDEAVSFYVKTLNEGDPYNKVVKSIDLINERQSTTLGLLCEVLRQAKILNGNGEIDFKQPDSN